MKVLRMERVAEKTMTTTCSALSNEVCIRPSNTQQNCLER